MKEKLVKLLENSYTPYYKYPVAAIVIMKDGQEFVGVNVETSSQGAGICAERNALFQAIANGYKKGDVQEIHIMSKTNDDCFPCFVCRHALNDLCDKKTKIISHTYNDTRLVTHTLEELCPYPFSDANIEGSKS